MTPSSVDAHALWRSTCMRTHGRMRSSLSTFRYGDGTRVNALHLSRRIKRKQGSQLRRSHLMDAACRCFARERACLLAQLVLDAECVIERKWLLCSFPSRGNSSPGSCPQPRLQQAPADGRSVARRPWSAALCPFQSARCQWQSREQHRTTRHHPHMPLAPSFGPSRAVRLHAPAVARPVCRPGGLGRRSIGLGRAAPSRSRPSRQAPLRNRPARPSNRAARAPACPCARWGLAPDERAR